MNNLPTEVPENIEDCCSNLVWVEQDVVSYMMNGLPYSYIQNRRWRCATCGRLLTLRKEG